MKRNLPADSEILQYLYRDGGVRGERIALRFRWLLAGLVFVLIGVMYTKGLIREASWSLVPVSIFVVYNLFLLVLFRKDRIGYWVRYVSIVVDIGVLSLHTYMYSRLLSPLPYQPRPPFIFISFCCSCPCCDMTGSWSFLPPSLPFSVST